ncbi:FeoB-associated Cys-rich membrane protein [Aquirufa sp. ROCK2-A2]
METLLIVLVFSGALFYLGRMVYLQFWGKNAAGCSKGCGSCSSISENLEQKELI